jgi:hypothetical protein
MSGSLGRHDRDWIVRTFALALVGAILLQVGWVVAVPPFRGLDEHDHAYKAAAVARGDWSPSHARSAEGWGEILLVPRDLVVAAGPVCESFDYTNDENCTPGRPGPEPGLVEVAGSAARYNPVFYYVIGTAARPFSGSTALYAMRAMGALLCALLIALALTACRPWSSSRWPAAAVLLAASPILVYSTAVAAPNGLELSGALLVWSALLNYGRMASAEGRVGTYAVLATVGALPVATVRSLGPLWLLLILVVCAMLMPTEHRKALVRSGTARACAAVVALATIAGVGWTLLAGTNAITRTGDDATGMWAALPRQFVLWFLQSVGAFPARNEPAPLLAYAVVFAAWGVLAATAWRLAGRQQRIALTLVLVLASAVPLAVTIRAYPLAGAVWQGRYSYPFAMGFLLICGHVLAGRDRRARRALPVLVAGGVLAVSQLVCQLAVLRQELRDSPLSGSDSWFTLPTAAMVLLAVAGAAGLTLAGLGPGSRRDLSGDQLLDHATLAQPRVAATQR